MKPTEELYQSLECAYQHFNEELFDGVLPPVLFTVQRQKGTLGYFVPDRWSSPSGSNCHEIAINPAHMGESRVIDVMQTLVHEMAHCWQYCFGTPSRYGYHNKEWAYKMIEVGLQPTVTGKPGGAIVGEHMSDYVIENGRFKHSCISLIQKREFHIPWIYRLTYSSGKRNTALSAISENLKPVEHEQEWRGSVEMSGEISREPNSLDTEHYLYSMYRELMPENTFVIPPVRKNSKSKYQCPSCYLNVWARSNVRLMCIDCDSELLPQ